MGITASVIFATACGHPSDRNLISNFNEHEATFIKLTEMAEQDKNVERIDKDWTCCPPVRAEEQLNEITHPPKEARLSEQRWNEYRSLFQMLNLQAGINKMGHRTSFLLREYDGPAQPRINEGVCLFQGSINPSRRIARHPAIAAMCPH